MTGRVLKWLRGSIAFAAGLLELARLRDELRIARWDADVPIRELREEIARLYATPGRR